MCWAPSRSAVERRISQLPEEPGTTGSPPQRTAAPELKRSGRSCRQPRPPALRQGGGPARPEPPSPRRLSRAPPRSGEGVPGRARGRRRGARGCCQGNARGSCGGLRASLAVPPVPALPSLPAAVAPASATLLQPPVVWDGRGGRVGLGRASAPAGEGLDGPHGGGRGRPLCEGWWRRLRGERRWGGVGSAALGQREGGRD